MLTLRSPLVVLALSLAASLAFASRPPSLAGCEIFPANSVWNTPVDRLPLDPNSALYVATVGAARTLFADFGSGTFQGGPIGIPFTTVSGGQARVPVTFLYSDESDPGPYPIPSDVPIEGGSASDGDRHALVLDRDNCVLYELYRAFPQGSGWRADSGAIFDLKSHALRPETWTSADAAGLPILPGLVRYDEVQEGEIRHAIRLTVPQTRRAYVWPARHYASSLTDPKYPPMGQRFRLRADFDDSGFSRETQIIARALKRYGMILADNGSSWFISGAPDERWNNDRLRELRRIVGSDLEAVDVSSLMVGKDSGRARAAAALVFPQAAVGGGYATRIALVNVGAEAAEALVEVAAGDGADLPVRFVEENRTTPLAAFSLAPGAARFLTATSDGGLVSGWLRLSAAGGAIGGAATFEQSSGSELRSAAAVLGSRPVRSAVIPVDNDDAGGRFTGYAVANPGSRALAWTLELRAVDGNLVRTLTPPALAANGQVARFIHQDIAEAATFQGSLVIRAGGAEFAAVALIERGGLVSALPVVERPD